jgi:hypothetical protein
VGSRREHEGGIREGRGKERKKGEIEVVGQMAGRGRWGIGLRIFGNRKRDLGCKKD